VTPPLAAREVWVPSVLQVEVWVTQEARQVEVWVTQEGRQVEEPVTPVLQEKARQEPQFAKAPRAAQNVSRPQKIPTYQTFLHVKPDQVGRESSRPVMHGKLQRSLLVLRSLLQVSQ
jgi:hypothetical protein